MTFKQKIRNVQKLADISKLRRVTIEQMFPNRNGGDFTKRELANMGKQIYQNYLILLRKKTTSPKCKK